MANEVMVEIRFSRYGRALGGLFLRIFALPMLALGFKIDTISRMAANLYYLGLRADFE